MALDDTGTIMTLTPQSGAIGPVLAPYSSRALSQSLDIIDNQAPRRCINGHLRKLAQPQFRKFKSTIRGNDVEFPALEGAWDGIIVEVNCLAERKRPVGAPAERPMWQEKTVGGFTIGNPTLLMMILPGGVRTTLDEWGRIASWEIDFEEI